MSHVTAPELPLSPWVTLSTHSRFTKEVVSRNDVMAFLRRNSVKFHYCCVKIFWVFYLDLEWHQFIIGNSVVYHGTWRKSQIERILDHCSWGRVCIALLCVVIGNLELSLENLLKKLRMSTTSTGKLQVLFPILLPNCGRFAHSCFAHTLFCPQVVSPTSHSCINAIRPSAESCKASEKHFL